VYERVTPKGKRPTFGTLVATQLVSGVWHGLFPGYWLFFATTALMFEAGKTLYRWGWVCGWVCGWVGVWVGGSGNGWGTERLANIELRQLRGKQC
jgi:hypothetical protein